MDIYVYAIKHELYGNDIDKVIKKALSLGKVTNEILLKAVQDGEITKDQYRRATGVVLP